MKVYKFGGASVKEAAGVRNLAEIARGTEGRLFIIVSAMGKTTNALERVMENFWEGRTGEAVVAMQQIVDYHATILEGLWGEPHLPQRVRGLYEELEEIITLSNPQSRSYEEWYDRIVSFGELISTTIVSEYLNYVGIGSHLLDMRRIFLTSNRFRDANIDIVSSTPRLQKAVELAEERVIVGQGFIGATEQGATTTIGREGSDYSAAVAGYILDAESVSIWKDVEGILNGDPKQFEDVSYIPELTYLDAIELAYSGAQIIHPKTIKPLQNKSIPLYVRCFVNPSLPGSVIKAEIDKPIDKPILILKKNQILLSIKPEDYSFILEERMAEIFRILESHRAKVHLVQNSAISMALCIDSTRYLDEIVEEFHKAGFTVKYNSDMELLTIRGYKKEHLQQYAESESVYMTQRSRKVLRIIRKTKTE
ncbi:MAG: aspartate kinase [Tidjanibacter sp.]|nr:aspartate kinase [Tidjanibacter sp.]